MRVKPPLDDTPREADRPLEEALSELARRALPHQPQTAVEGGFPVFEVSAGTPSTTLETVQQALAAP
jgi:hypothetical protein